jgi:histidine triad (HIT) family protein
MDDCIFCKIIKGELPSKKEFEDEDVIVIHDIAPATPIHLLVIPKKHIVNLSTAQESDKELLGKMNLIAAQVARKLGTPDQFKLTTNSGKLAGQMVMHLHYHLLAGWKNKDDVKSELHL